MKLENWLWISALLFAFISGGLVGHYLLPKNTITTQSSITTVTSPPDSTIPILDNKPVISKPTKIIPVKPQNSNVAVKDSAGHDFIPNPTPNTPIEKIASYLTVSDSLGEYIIKAIAPCAVEEFAFTAKHKPFTLPIGEVASWWNKFYIGFTSAILIVLSILLLSR